MRFVPSPNFIVVRINRELQNKRKEKEGSLYIVTSGNDESRNMQSGEIVALGVNLSWLFPQAKIGDIAILHWMVEAKEKNNLIYQDETYNYYIATATECNGRVSELYGVWDGKKIVAHPDYIFLELQHEAKSGLTPDEYIESATRQTDGGVYVFDEWHQTRTDKEQKMAEINAQIQSLSKTRMSDQLKQGIKEKENELAAISADINKVCIEFYNVAAINPDLNEEIKSAFGRYIEVGERVGCLNAACKTTVTFNGKEYIAVLSKHFYLPEYWARQSIKDFNPPSFRGQKLL